MSLTELGLAGLIAVALLVVLTVVWVRRHSTRARGAVATIQRENEELRRANGHLRGLAEFAAGLSARSHDSRSLAAYARTSLQRLTGAHIEISVGDDDQAGGVALSSDGRIVGRLLVEGGDGERWAGLREPVAQQLAAALAATARAEEVRRTHLETITVLSRSMDAKDDFTGRHTERVSEIAVGLAKRLGYSGADLDAIEIGALLHDIGKIGIPGSILHKPGPLDNDEWVVMKRHPVIAEVILSEIELSPIVLEIARFSHERLDGEGYPDGLGGDAIPLPARIVLVADAFDALTSHRPYRRARRPRAAVEEIKAHAGSQFCPTVVAALERLWQEDPAVLGETERLSIVA